MAMALETDEDDNGEVEGQMNVKTLSQLSLDDFLNRFELNIEIKKALTEQGVETTELLLECDTTDIVSISKNFNKYKEISIQDKLTFRKIMKNIIEENEKQMELKNAAKKRNQNANGNNSQLFQSPMLILSNKEHELMSNIYSKLDNIDKNKKLMQNNINNINKISENNIIKINNYFNSLIKLLKQRQNELLSQHNNILNNKVNDYKNIIL